jgi:hypothetical protein
MARSSPFVSQKSLAALSARRAFAASPFIQPNQPVDGSRRQRRDIDIPTFKP